MPRFVFRAEAALDLRRREEEAAERARAEAAAALDRALAALAEAERTWTEGLAAGASVRDPAARQWYRNWSVGRRLEIDRRRAVVAERSAALEAAEARRRRARRDVRALERLKSRAWAAWLDAERRAEQKELDWLGGVRHTLKARAEQEDR